MRGRWSASCYLALILFPSYSLSASSYSRDYAVPFSGTELPTYVRMAPPVNMEGFAHFSLDMKELEARMMDRGAKKKETVVVGQEWNLHTGETFTRAMTVRTLLDSDESTRNLRKLVWQERWRKLDASPARQGRKPQPVAPDGSIRWGRKEARGASESHVEKLVHEPEEHSVYQQKFWPCITRSLSVELPQKDRKHHAEIFCSVAVGEGGQHRGFDTEASSTQ
ncbi:hypothetical protein GUITHDRAFT_141434 [Guillardia theta CCMP2712]|uniref:Uncharacterized protein n=1 Tax=Guillardia theta (strain CCMP2712) TaxID=905079 RepID=L1J1Q5_GUITC|nr:hypothetical protein GUITHDRAFT_141434 [Guillardia theta CCMP2712]EKX42237.1 hypothetical protein GUITHDRAFT_141434 [Guillardia theta CCMP2712]|eukprot:XP_005829217.1 hypothetical protein GUITHDRAFT_141434 [Guillardia theta CCMP2712]